MSHIVHDRPELAYPVPHCWIECGCVFSATWICSLLICNREARSNSSQEFAAHRTTLQNPVLDRESVKGTSQLYVRRRVLGRSHHLCNLLYVANRKRETYMVVIAACMLIVSCVYARFHDEKVSRPFRQHALMEEDTYRMRRTGTRTWRRMIAQEPTYTCLTAHKRANVLR
jgi:hypothetical protein